MSVLQQKPPSGEEVRRTMAYGVSGGVGTTRSEQEFARARQRAILQDMLAFLRWNPRDLLSFEQVRQQLRLEQSNYLGIQEIPLKKIVGSMARYDDFTRTFLPRREHLSKRWREVNALTFEGGLPPIEVYKVDEIYFVRDGNHRISVARQAGMETIEGHVWEYSSRVPLEEDDDEKDVFIRNEYLAFLDKTQLDQTCPNQRLVFTHPGYYRLLEMEIGLHRHYLEQTEERTLTLQEAAYNWYTSIYKPMADYIAQENLLELFPGHTEADLIGWMIEYRDWLARRSGEEVNHQDVLETFHTQRTNPFQRAFAWVMRKLGRPVYNDRRSN